MFTKSIKFVIASVSLALMSGTAMAQGTIVEVATKNGSFNTLVAAIKAAGLADIGTGNLWMGVDRKAAAT